MNSTWIKIGIAYTAGMITYAVYQNYQEAGQIKEMMSISSPDTSDMVSLPLADACACENESRYDVDPKTDSKNQPIGKLPDCQTMVNGVAGSQSGEKETTAEPKGAWFSKLTLDLMFCHAPTANGIFVYKGMDVTGKYVYIVEAARDNAINTTDDGSATMYVSYSLCPTMCGACGK